MGENDAIRCSVAACLEVLGDGNEWSFYFINDGVVSVDRAVLKTFGREWGDFGDAKHPDVEVTDVPSGANVLMWRDNDDELRMWLKLLVVAGDQQTEMIAEFPMLYRKKPNLPVVASVGRPGLAVRAMPIGQAPQ